MAHGDFQFARHGPLYIGLGAFFWLVAALFIRFSGPSLFHLGNPWLGLLFVSVVPLGWVFVQACLVVGGLDRRDALAPISLASATGLLLDGLAISAFRSLYGETMEHVMLGAAWLLWGVGVLLAIASFMQLRHPD
jgi:hypothetical protein